MGEHEKAIREALPVAYKCGNEFAPYHPSASHVDPSYRDGWNACYEASRERVRVLEAENECLRATQVPLTADQRKDILAAALCISAREDDTAVLHSADADRIAEFLCDLSGIDLDAAIEASQAPACAETPS